MSPAELDPRVLVSTTELQLLRSIAAVSKLVIAERDALREQVEVLAEAARNALTRLDREDAEKRAEGKPAPHDGSPFCVNAQLRYALCVAKAESRA